jgi:hypothetical protein
MRSDYYIHPEFGYLAPTGRFRRELKVGLLSVLFGMATGVAAVSGISLGSREHDRHSEPSAAAHGIVAGSPIHEEGSDGSRKVAPAGASEPSTQNADSNIAASNSKPDPSTGRIRNSALTVKEACQGNVDASCSSKGEHTGSRPRSLPRITGSPAIARLPLGRSGPSSSGTSQSDVRPDLAPATPLAKQLPAPAGTERGKQKKKALSQNASRHFEINSANSREDSENISTARAEESQTRRLGRRSARDSSGHPRGFWAWSR